MARTSLLTGLIVLVLIVLFVLDRKAHRLGHEILATHSGEMSIDEPIKA